MRREPTRQFQDFIVRQKAHQSVLSTYPSNNFSRNLCCGDTSRFKSQPEEIVKLLEVYASSFYSGFRLLTYEFLVVTRRFISRKA